MKKKQRNKMVHVTVAFWTNGIGDHIKQAVPAWKLAWESGVVYVTAGKDWKKAKPVHFHSSKEIPALIESALDEARVMLLPTYVSSIVSEKADENRGKK